MKRVITGLLGGGLLIWGGWIFSAGWAIPSTTESEMPGVAAKPDYVAMALLMTLGSVIAITGVFLSGGRQGTGLPRHILYPSIRIAGSR
jgi:hypothetical protein